MAHEIGIDTYAGNKMPQEEHGTSISVWPEKQLEHEYSFFEDQYVNQRGRQLKPSLGIYSINQVITPSSVLGPRDLRAHCNAGTPIGPAAMQRLFYPFSRGKPTARKQGLGLGLYIASEIAKAHGGTIDVTSTPELTCFTFKMRLQP